MTASPPVLLAAYATAVFVVSVVGGRLAEYGTMTHMRMQIVMSFVAGFILGIAMFHLMPHALEHIPGPNAIETAALWIVIGMVALVFLLRVFHFHQHDFSAEGVQQPRRGSLVGIALGLGLHTITEGAALGASVRLGLVEEGVLPGLGVCLAILLHKPLDAYSITGMMKHAGKPAPARLVANVGYGLICPLTAVASFFGAGMLGPVAEGPVVGAALAFAAGAFLCIALSDLLPEIHFHRHDRGKLLIALGTGIGLAYGLYFVEVMVVHDMAQH